jgi:hypothetical protein
MSCCDTLSKNVLYFVNFVFGIIGCAILGGATYAADFSHHFDDFSAIGGRALLVGQLVGGSILLISAIGCCGVYHKNRCLLGVYNIILFLVLIAEIAAGVVILESMGHLKELEGKIPHSGDAVKEFEKGVNTLVNQTYQACCNVNTTKKIDAKVCNLIHDIVESDCDNKEAFRSSLLAFIRHHVRPLGISLVVIAVAQFMFWVMSCRLFCAPKTPETDEEGRPISNKNNNMLAYQPPQQGVYNNL